MLNDPFYKSLKALRDDAVERGLLDLATMYGWALMRRGEQIVLDGIAKSKFRS